MDYKKCWLTLWQRKRRATLNVHTRRLCLRTNYMATSVALPLEISLKSLAVACFITVQSVLKTSWQQKTSLVPTQGSFKGKTTWTKWDHDSSAQPDWGYTPYDIIKLYQNVTLCFDIMFVNKIAFLVTVSWKIRFSTTENLTPQHIPVFGKTIHNIIVFYVQQEL